jgi:hypothetical protein
MKAWNLGCHSPHAMFTDEDRQFLKSIGCSDQEMFDFVDDLSEYGEPDFDTVLGIQEMRRDYFLNEMKGCAFGFVASMSELPSKSQAVEGITWLPRLIVKARLKLRGEMPPDLMYGCGGDRPFLRRMKMTLPSFLALVRDCGADDAKIVASVKKSAGL